MAVSDDLNYGKCYPCFAVEGPGPIQIDPKPGSKLVLKEFYDKLASQQEPLPPEFQKVIDDNFWELLVKT